jgi:TRAP-type C4-dicarboxylate transport system substrate-binding protein
MMLRNLRVEGARALVSRVTTMVRSLAFAVGAVVALAAAPACAQIKWRLPSAYPANNFHVENLGAFAKEVADATDGKLAITVHPNASLFKATEIKSAVRIGQAQMGEVLISLHENEDPVFGIESCRSLRRLLRRRAACGPHRSRRSRSGLPRKG